MSNHLTVQLEIIDKEKVNFLWDNHMSSDRGKSAGYFVNGLAWGKRLASAQELSENVEQWFNSSAKEKQEEMDRIAAIDPDFSIYVKYNMACDYEIFQDMWRWWLKEKEETEK
jgi:hypothetical protein